MSTAADLCAYIAASPTPHHAVDTSMRRLAETGFTTLDERDRWPDGPGNFMVARHGSLVAWRQPAHLDPHGGIRLVGAHTDSPNLRLKPHPDVAGTTSGHWRQVAVETYGGCCGTRGWTATSASPVSWWWPTEPTPARCSCG